MAHRWYIIHAYSGFEKKVAQSILEQAANKGLAGEFEEILVPTEEMVEVRRGKKVQSERKLFPGYVLAKMEMSDESYHLIKNTPKVTGFLGTGARPSAISQGEVDRILHQIQEGTERPKPLITFEVGTCPPQSGGVDLRPGDAGRTGVHAGRETLGRLSW
jgi:transcriptional antiterminator NusG